MAAKKPSSQTAPTTRFHLVLAVNHCDGAFNRKSAQSAAQCAALAWLAFGPEEEVSGADETNDMQHQIRQALLELEDNSTSQDVSGREGPHLLHKTLVFREGDLEVALTVADSAAALAAALDDVRCSPQDAEFIYVAASTRLSADQQNVDLCVGNDTYALSRDLFQSLAAAHPDVPLLVELCGPNVVAFWGVENDPNGAQASDQGTSSSAPSGNMEDSAGAQPLAFLRGVTIQTNFSCAAVAVTSSTPETFGLCEILHQARLGNGYHRGMSLVRNVFLELAADQASAYLDIIVFGRDLPKGASGAPRLPRHKNNGNSIDTLTKQLEQLEVHDNHRRPSKLFDLAKALASQKRYTEAIERFREARQHVQSPRFMANIYCGLGYAYKDVGKYAEAIKWQKRSLESHERASSDDLTMMSASMSLADAYTSAGQDDQALIVLSEALERYNDCGNTSLADAHQRIGCIHTFTTRDFNDAAEHLRQARALASTACDEARDSKKKQRPQKILANATNVLGRAVLELGDFEGGIGHMREAAKLKSERFGATSREVVRVRVNLAFALFDYDQMPESRQLFQECLMDQLTNRSISLADQIDTLNNIAKTYQRDDNVEQAMAYLDRAQRLYSEAVESLDVPASAVTTLHLRATLLLQQGSVRKAEQVVAQARRLGRSVDGNEGKRIDAVNSRLKGDIAIARREADAAVLEYQRCVGLLQDLGDEYQAAFAENAHAIAQRLRQHRRYEEARAYIQEAVEILRHLHGDEYPALARARQLQQSIKQEMAT